MKIFLEIFAWYGTIVLISSYAMMSFKIIPSNSYVYQISNLTGALGIMLISYSVRAYQPAILNLVWAVIAAVALIKLFLKK